MASNEHTLDDNASSSDALSTAVQALSQATQVLIATVTQMQTGASLGQPIASGGATATQATIDTWEDDPFSEVVPTPDPPVAAPVTVNVPINNFPRLQVAITEPGPPPARHPLGTPNFRYWTAVEALVRGINFWGPLLPAGTRWSIPNPMQVTLVAGQDLNANYSRQASGLRFYQQTVRGITVYSAESPNVSQHELGHAILDAVRPQLWNVAFFEAGALHESLGDISAILSELQLPTVRQKVLSETQGQLNATSRLSRLGEQIGWAIRQRFGPSAADPDCLRNAANRFFYRPPAQLPPGAPANQLSSEPHSLSRVFTGAFLDALSNMLIATGAANDANLLAVSHDMGQLLIDGVRTAPITTDFFSQVAAAMIQADRARNNGRYRNALSQGFVRHGILSPTAIHNLSDAQVPQLTAVATPSEDMVGTAGMADFGGFGGAGGTKVPTYNDNIDDSYRRSLEDIPELPTRSISTDFGVTLLVRIPDEQERFDVAPAALDIGSVDAPSPEEDARLFMEDLVRQGRVELGRIEGLAPGLDAPTTSRPHAKTHTIVDTSEGEKVLERLHFDCGFHCCH